MTNSTTAQISFIRKLQDQKAWKGAQDVESSAALVAQNSARQFAFDLQSRNTFTGPVREYLDAAAARIVTIEDEGTEATAYGQWMAAAYRTGREELAVALTTDPAALDKAEASRIIDLLKNA